MTEPQQNECEQLEQRLDIVVLDNTLQVLIIYFSNSD